MPNRPSKLSQLFGVAALLAAVPVAMVLDAVGATAGDRPEQAVMRIGAVLAVLMLAPVLVTFLRRRGGDAAASQVGLVALISLAVGLSAVVFYVAWDFMTFPADLIVYSEADYLNDIIKLRVGHPVYTPQPDNASYVYTPGSQMMTWALASLAGAADSLTVLRGVQVLYGVLSAVLAASCARMLVLLARPERAVDARWWMLWVPALFLVATNGKTNIYTLFLNVDAFAQLVFVFAYWVLCRWVVTHDKKLLVLMIVLPGLGFLAKQNVVMWVGIYAGYLLVFDERRSLRDVALVAVAGTAVCGAVIAICYGVWGDPFVYWVFTALKNHKLRPLRSLLHFLEAWPYFAVGLFAGYVLLKKHRRPLLGLWLVWLGALTLQAYTSGIGFHMNHLGPGSLIGAAWFFAALCTAWPALTRRSDLKAVVVTATVALVFSGLHTVRIPQRMMTPDTHRYVRDLEAVAAGHDVEKVLVDIGAWMHNRAGIVWRDGAVTVGEVAYTQTGDFEPFKERLRRHDYEVLVVRRLHSRKTWYDHDTLKTSTGIREAMLEHYTEIRRIPAAEAEGDLIGVAFDEASILVPKTGP